MRLLSNVSKKTQEFRNWISFLHIKRIILYCNICIATIATFCILYVVLLSYESKLISTNALFLQWFISSTNQYRLKSEPAIQIILYNNYLVKFYKTHRKNNSNGVLFILMDSLLYVWASCIVKERLHWRFFVVTFL